MSDKPVSITNIQNDHDVLIRIEERTIEMARCLVRIEEEYVTYKEFQPVRILVYGACGLLLTTMLGAIAAMVLRG